MLRHISNYAALLVGVWHLLAFFVNAKLLNVEFSGYVDAEATTFQQFCTAMWKTYAQLSWSQATAYCNSTTPEQAMYVVTIVRGNIITVVQNVNVTVAHFASEIDNLTANLQESGFLYSSEKVSYVSDSEFNKTTAMIATSLIFGFTFIYTVVFYIMHTYK
jgi:hypothetical protein